MVDTFINSIYLYDDKVLITFNYKEGTQTIPFEKVEESKAKGNGSDFDCVTAPRKTSTHCVLVFLFRCERGLEQGGGAQHRKQSHSAAVLSPRFPTCRNVYRESAAKIENPNLFSLGGGFGFFVLLVQRQFPAQSPLSSWQE